MPIFRVYAFTVEPTRTIGNTIAPEGGKIGLTQKLVDALESNISKAKFEKRTSIAFQVDTATRTNEVRNLILSYTFGESSTSSAAALKLASKLSNAMDFRSHPGLFVIAASEEVNKRSVILWLFPRDEAFYFQRKRAGSSIKILTDIFSQTSLLRKAVKFEGKNLQTQFLEGRALDFEANKRSKAVADFWIAEFLMCSFSLRGEAGTRLVAKALRSSIDTAVESSEKEQLLGAMIELRQSPRRRWSPQQIADGYLEGTAKELFLSNFATEDTLVESFDFQPELFSEILKFRVFQLDTGVFVYSPIAEIGVSVLIDDQRRNLICRGTIIDEKVRARYA
jgi:hypothetical protein